MIYNLVQNVKNKMFSNDGWSRCEWNDIIGVSFTVNHELNYM